MRIRIVNKLNRLSGQYFKYVHKAVFTVMFLLLGINIPIYCFFVYMPFGMLPLNDVWPTVLGFGSGKFAEDIYMAMLMYVFMLGFPLQLWFFNITAWWIGYKRGKMYWVYGTLPIWIRVLFILEIVFSAIPVLIALMTVVIYIIGAIMGTV